MSIKVAVVCGGSSVEHEVSVITAMQAAAALDRNKYTPVALYITKDNRFFTGEHLLDINSYKNIPAALEKAMEVIPVRREGKSFLMSFPPRTLGKGTFIEIDAVLTAVHGTNVEDGTLQGLLEYWGVPYTGCDVCASAAGMDKWVMKALFKAMDIPCLDGLCIGRTEFYADMEAVLDRVGPRWAIRPWSSPPTWAPASASARPATGRRWRRPWPSPWALPRRPSASTRWNTCGRSTAPCWATATAPAPRSARNPSTPPIF